MPWDPDLYLTYADERGRPFLDLLARVHAVEPRTVVDLGCGPGNLTTLLAQRWPAADVLGVDSSSEMVEGADVPGVRLAVARLEEWDGTADVVVSNAALQWVPGHLELLPALAARAAEWFAFQVPGNFDAPSHAILHELASDPRFSSHTRDVHRPDAFDAATYLAVLAREGWLVDAWETTYLHVLPGDDAVFTWISATGARPTLEALPDGLRQEFEREYKARLREAYPVEAHGTVLPFRRVFVVAHRPSARG